MHIADRTDDPDIYVFPDITGGPWREVWWYQNIFKPACRRAGLSDSIRCHDLRHTYASRLIAQGESLFTVARQMGHSTTKVTESRYGHLFPSTLDALAERLDATFRENTAALVHVAEVRQIRRSATA